MLLWLALVSALMAFRVLMLVVFRREMAPESGAGDVLKCLASGLPYDISMASYAVAPVMAASLISFYVPLGKWLPRLRWVVATLLTVVCVLTFITDVGYFQEYHDQFNHWIFGLIFDDRQAIAATIWKSYPIVWLVVLAVGLIAGLLWSGSRAGARVLRMIPFGRVRMAGPAWSLLPVAVFAMLIFGMRGSFGARPVQVTAFATTQDEFLNKLVLNPFCAFKRAVNDHKVRGNARGLAAILPGGDVRGAANALYPKAAAGANLDEHLVHTAAGSPVIPPKHVFVIVEESYDTWGMQPENRDLQLNERLSALARSGMMADALVSGGDHTIASLSALISGTIDTGVNVNYQPLPKKGLPIAPAAIFKKLGYRTRFFYPGFKSWQRIGDFCREQGFDEVYSAVEIAPELPHTEWGVPDEKLFGFAQSLTSDQPTFNVFMTISYHSPFTVDVEAKGFPRAALAKQFAEHGFNDEQIRVLAHLWYADKCLGDFVAAAEKNFPRSLFAITGDHWSRREFKKRSSLLIQRTVPFVLYGPEVLSGLARPSPFIGSHLDVMPTLIELCAPRGFTYHSFGRNMFDSSTTAAGYGNNAVVTPQKVIDVLSHSQVQDYNGQTLANGPEDDALRLRYQQLGALNWWRVMKGPDL
jgi:phosphoglycerol transferase MdoB-like AlkP superfamily enzyme